MEYKEFIDKLGEDTGLGKLEIEFDNHVVFTADGMPIHLDYLTECDIMLVFSEFYDIPPVADANLFKALLEMNYLYFGTRGCTLSKNPNSDKLVLTDKIQNFSNFDYENIIEVIDRVVNCSERLGTFLENYRSTVENTENALVDENEKNLLGVGFTHLKI